MSEVEVQTEDKRAKFFEGVEQPKKQKNKPKKEVIMTWGKYKGKLVKDVLLFDEKYAGWVYRQEFVKKFEDIYKLLDDHFKDEPTQ
jgi:uncharacterized protein (DUF3820 family)